MYKEKQLWGGDVFEFNESWWNQREMNNIFFVSYENMKSNPNDSIKNIGNFLNTDLTDIVIDEVSRETSFAKMSENSRLNGDEVEKLGIFDMSISKFMRKGQIGDWKNYFTEQQLTCMKEQFEKSQVHYWVILHYQ